MKEFSLFEKISAILVGIAGLLYAILKLILLIQAPGRTGTTNDGTIIYGVGALVGALVILGALLFAILERKVLVGIIVASLKITLPAGGEFIRNVLTGVKMDFSNPEITFNLLFFLIGVVLMVMLPFVMKDTKFERTPFKWLSYLGPILVFGFLILFVSFESALVSFLVEVISLLLLSIMTARLLFISVFVVVPFDMIDYLVDSSDRVGGVVLSFGQVAYWVIGILLLAFGIYALIVHIHHAKHEKHEDTSKPEQEPALE